jgi:tetratricopeptide (TPR) repeat protein
MPYNLIGRAYAVLGNFEQAATLLARGIPLAEQFNDLELLAGSLAFYALTLAHQGLWTEAVGYAQRALTLSTMMNAPERTAATQMVVGAFHTYCGFWEEGHDYLSQAILLAQELNALQVIFVCQGTLGYIFLRRGEQEKAVEHFRACLALNEQHPQLQVNLPMYHAHWAESLFPTAGWEVTVQRLQEAIELAKTMNQPIAQAQARQSLARILLAAPEPDWQQAEQHLLDSIVIYERGNGLTYIAICCLELGQLYSAKSLLPEAQTLLNESLKSFKLYKMTWYQKQAEQALALFNLSDAHHDG